MLDKQDIYTQIYDIAHNLLDEEYRMIEDKNRLLHVILSESVQALQFVCSLEDEFEIEFDDDEIDLDFFSDFNTVTERVLSHLES